MTSAEIGISAAVAGTIVGMYWFLMLCGRLVGASVGGKVSSRAMAVSYTHLTASGDPPHFVLLAMKVHWTFINRSRPPSSGAKATYGSICLR